MEELCADIRGVLTNKREIIIRRSSGTTVGGRAELRHQRGRTPVSGRSRANIRVHVERKVQLNSTLTLRNQNQQHCASWATKYQRHMTARTFISVWLSQPIGSEWESRT